jgi:Fic-DOC domain mobile mystery protein B
MGLDLAYIGGQTPLDEDEKDGLLIPTVATREELDEFEQQNIEDAIQWLLSRSTKKEEVVTGAFVRNLHKHMFGKVWAWAGDYRKSNKNFGVDKYRIPSDLQVLIDDTSYWIDSETFNADEIAIRFKHRLVSIHCFPNGNGRHSRLMADIIINKIYQLTVFTWGKENLTKRSDTRREYITALKDADQNCYEPLLSFARS